MRYRMVISFDGTGLAGWQRQENALSVQEILEEKLSVKLRQPTEVTGCGRTDAGVHASSYVLHFDFPEPLSPDFVHAINQMLPPQISVHSVDAAPAGFHARFDAISRSYKYHIHSRKDPFKTAYSYYYPRMDDLDLEQLNAVASLLPEYDSFAPFCKSRSDVKTMRCMISQAAWQMDRVNHRYTFEITADRFLRGMVRLIVGASLQAGLGRLSVEEIRDALGKQIPLSRPWSVPAEGLFLTDVQYPK